MNNKKDIKLEYKSFDNSIIIHIPHASTIFPKKVERRFTIDKEYIMGEAIFMSDYLVDLLLPNNDVDVLKFEFSRMFCDVERFKDDDKENMSTLGMGAIYEKDSNGIKYINIDKEYKEEVLKKYYDTHHKKLTRMVEDKLKKYDNCLIIDLHSFSDEFVGKVLNKHNTPDICIGIEDYYKDEQLTKLLLKHFIEYGYFVKINYPYSGSIVPIKYLNNKNNNLVSIMIEINKRLYLDGNCIKYDDFNRLKICIDNLYSKIKNYINKTKFSLL